MRKLEPYLPVIFGLLLGWFLTHPPAMPGGWVAVGGVGALFFLAIMARVILSNLPEVVKTGPPERPDLPAEVLELVARIEALGFQAGAPMQVEIAPPAVLVPLAEREGSSYATVFRTETVPAKVAFDFVSLADNRKAGLTTGAEPGGGALPGGPACMRQILPGQGPEELCRRHRDALEWLKGKGLQFEAATLDRFPEVFARSFRVQRDAYLANPLWNTLVTVWRAVTGRNPHLGPLEEQACAHKQLARQEREGWWRGPS